MRRFALSAVPLLALASSVTPAAAADLDGPVYRERDVVIERPAPPVVRERIIERNYYYEPEPTYSVRAYVPTYYHYAPKVYGVYGYGDDYRWDRRRAFFVGRPFGWHHHRHWRY